MQEEIKIFENKLGEISDKFNMNDLLENFRDDLFNVKDGEGITDEMINSAVFANTMMFTNMIHSLVAADKKDAAFLVCENTHLIILLNSLMIDTEMFKDKDTIDTVDMFLEYSEFIFDFLDKNVI